MTNKILYVILGLSIVLNVVSGVYIFGSKKTENTSTIATKSVKSYIYHNQESPFDKEKYTFGTLTTKVIPDFEIPQGLDVIVNKTSKSLDTAVLKKEIPQDSVLLKIDIAGSPFGNTLNESTILTYSDKTVDQIIQDEKNRAEKAKSGYEITKVKEDITLLKRNDSYGAYADFSIELFQEVYLINVEKYNNGLTSSPKTFLLIPTHYSDTQLDILKKDLDKMSIIDLPYHALPVY